MPGATGIIQKICTALALYGLLAVLPANVALGDEAKGPTPTEEEVANPSPRSLSKLDGTDLYLAQVVAQLGAEHFFFIASLCPPLSFFSLILLPGAGALTVDWVGREMGGIPGSQLAALLTNYGLSCIGVGTLALGFFLAYSSLVLLPLARENSAPLIGLLLGGVGMSGAGLLVFCARPFIIPLVWATFVSDVEEGEIDAPAKRKRGRFPRPTPAPKTSGLGVAF